MAGRKPVILTPPSHYEWEQHILPNEAEREEQQYNVLLYPPSMPAEDPNPIPKPIGYELEARFNALKLHEQNVVEFIRLSPHATLPTRGTPRSAGLDLYAIEQTHIQPRKFQLVRTGLAMLLPTGVYGRIAPRSSLPTIFINGGVIDPDYTGELKVMMYNLGTNKLTIRPQQRVAQLILEKSLNAKPRFREEPLPPTARADKGFGSTDPTT